jgi:hypothetical protein
MASFCSFEYRTLFFPFISIDLRVIYLTITLKYRTTSTLTEGVIEHTSLEQAVSSLQERFESEGYEDKGELESTPLEENGLRGEMQFFTYPVKGFYAYEIDEHVLVITYQYPGEAEDGMHPLLESLRKSIKVQ